MDIYIYMQSQLDLLVKLQLKLGGCILEFVQDGWNHSSLPNILFVSMECTTISVFLSTLTVTGTKASECWEDTIKIYYIW